VYQTKISVFTSDAVDYFKLTKENIEKQTASMDSTDSGMYIKKWIEELFKIQQVELLSAKTAPIYFSAVQMVVGHVVRIKFEAKQIVHGISCSEDSNSKELNKKYTKLFCHVSILKSMKWIDELRPSTYTNVLGNLSREVTSHLNNISNAAREIEVDQII
jgi:hypothetical protein